MKEAFSFILAVQCRVCLTFAPEIEFFTFAIKGNLYQVQMMYPSAVEVCHLTEPFDVVRMKSLSLLLFIAKKKKKPSWMRHISNGLWVQETLRGYGTCSESQAYIGWKMFFCFVCMCVISLFFSLLPTSFSI